MTESDKRPGSLSQTELEEAALARALEDRTAADQPTQMRSPGDVSAINRSRLSQASHLSQAGNLSDVNIPPSSGAASQVSSVQSQARSQARPAQSQVSAAPSLMIGIPVEKTEVIAERLVTSLDRASSSNAHSQSSGNPGGNQGPAVTPDFVSGAVIKDRFLLQEQIGSGGMGVVFAAIDKRKEEARDPNPWVAIKILGGAFAGYANAFIVLQREARKAQSLAHPNVATVFDFDRDGSAVYMTMELLRGRSLDRVVRDVRGRGLDNDEAWRIICGVAEGLAYAHRKGIVHSDLKPGNIFLLDDGHPKILDFGIARAVPTPSEVAGKKAAEGALTEAKDTYDAGKLGAYTEPYATAEMIAGIDPHPADDIYALGLITYELLTGTHPFNRQGAVKAQSDGMKYDMPKGLTMRQRRVLERSLSFDRKVRPHNAGEFLRELTGVTRLQQILIAATAVLVLIAGYFGYQSYVEAGPAVPFATLSAEVQQEFQTHMSEGNQLLQFFEQDRTNSDAWQNAVNEYEAAYRLHPRNRDAVRGLKKTADQALDSMQGNRKQQQAVAETLMILSPSFLAKYAPVTDAAK